ncbi:hypothetical protein E4T43_00544 [Aureobasidium subglaciale]|nr:hypothetical protein E4T43_00544 [Aureobasidium subglaciale]
MSTYRQPEMVFPDAPEKLILRDQLLIEVMLKTTRLYVRQRIRQSRQDSSKKSTLNWPQLKKTHLTTTNHVQSVCDRVFAVQELADAILAHLDDFHDVHCCLAVNRTIRHAVQQSLAPKKMSMPFRECEASHLFYMEKQLDLLHPPQYWQSHSQRFHMNSGCIMYPRNAPWPLLVSIYDVTNSIGELRKRRVTIDIGFSASGRSPSDFQLDGSWLDLSLPLQDTVTWALTRPVPRRGIHLVFPYKLVTESRDHLRQIALYAKKAYSMHRHCQNDAGDPQTGLSSVTFTALSPEESHHDLIDTCTHTTRPSPKFRADRTIETPQKKSRDEVLEDILLALAVPRSAYTWAQLVKDNPPGRNLPIVLRNVGYITPEDFVRIIGQFGQISAWDRLMGRTEMKLGY